MGRSWVALTVLQLITFLGLFYIVPLIEVIQISLSSGGWTEVIWGQLFITFLKFSFTQAILTTVFCLLIGIPTGYALTRLQPFARKFLSVLVLVPFLIPPMSILLGFVIIYEPNGLLTQLLGFQLIDVFGTLSGVVLAHTIYNISIVTRLIASNFESLDEDKITLAKSSGASPLEVWRYVYLPHILPSIYASILLVFLLSFNSFAVVLMIGNVKLQTLEVMIYSQSRLRLNYGLAAKIAIIQLLINVLVTIAFIRITKETKYTGTYRDPPEVSKKLRILSTGWIFAVILFTWQSILATVYQLSRTSGRSYILDGRYSSLLGTSPLRVIENTLFFGVMTGVLATSFAISLLVQRLFKDGRTTSYILGFISIMPMMSSSITLSLGLLLAYRSTSFFSDDIWIFIVASHILASLPFVTQTVLTGAKQVPTEYITLSQSLGATKLGTMRYVLLPLLAPSIIVAFLFGMAVSFGEFGATFFLVRGEWSTISIGIQRLFATRSNFLPLQYSLILVLITLLSFSLVERLRK